MTTTISVSLPESMKSFLETQALQEGFGDVNEYIRAVFCDLQQRTARQELEAKLREGLRSPTLRLTEEHWQALEQEVRQRSRELHAE